MEAKDTVMDVEEVIKIISRSLDYVPASVYCALERQAEITWNKATEFLDLTSETQYRAGIKAAIDYLGVYENELGFCEISNHTPYIKLKEWGTE